MKEGPTVEYKYKALELRRCSRMMRAGMFVI
jgi:hypothetical protein